MDELERWLEKAERDILMAHRSAALGAYEWAIRQAVYAAEIALRTYLALRRGEYLRLHEVFEFAETAQSPERVQEASWRLAFFQEYEGLLRDYTPEEAAEAVRLAEEVLQWVRESISIPSSYGIRAKTG
jgi:HEPN domain-containing protein